MSTEQNKSIVRRYIEDGYGKRNVSVLQEVFARDVCDHNPAPGQTRGLEGERWFFETFFRAFPDTTTRLLRLVAEGDYVVDYWTASGTHTGEMMGMAPTGKRYTMTGMDLTRISNGKIIETWHQEDMLSMMQQLGYAPAMESAPVSGARPATYPTKEPGRGRMLSDEEKRSLIRRGYQEFIDRHNTSVADTLVTPDFKGHFSAAPEINGREAFKQFISMYNNAFSNHHAQVENVLVDGDYLACRVTFTGKHTGGLFGAPSSGKQVNNQGLSIFRFVGDQVAEQWANNDDLGLLQQIGAVPVQAGMPVPEPC